MKLPNGFPYHCVNCKHLRMTGLPSCEAFPEAIPYDIYQNLNSHLLPVVGDHDIQYEPDDDMLANLRAAGLLEERELLAA